MSVSVGILVGIGALNLLVVLWTLEVVVSDAIRDLDARIRLARFERRYHKEMDALECAWLLDPPNRERHA